MVKVDATKVMDTLRTVVAERPDYVYEAPAEQVETGEGLLSCFYVHGAGAEAEPGCLVGHVLYRHGVSLVDLAAKEGAGAYNVTTELVELTGEPGTVSDVIGVLMRVQDAQDNGQPWARALEHATRRAGE
jgi:hypothetical protein